MNKAQSWHLFPFKNLLWGGAVPFLSPTQSLAYFFQVLGHAQPCSGVTPGFVLGWPGGDHVVLKAEAGPPTCRACILGFGFLPGQGGVFRFVLL